VRRAAVRPAQSALAELWPASAWKLRRAAVLTWLQPSAQGALHPEIGFRQWGALMAMAAESPDRNFLGAEVHAPGVGHCLLAIERLGLTNVRLLRQDAVEVLREQLPEHGLAGVHLFFPDPWHKKRHHKRRLPAC
jgi:tRNA (guanine-N7-)-methyltransferase